MGVHSLLNQAVQLIDQSVNDVVVSVTHEAFISFSGDSVATYGAAVTRRGVVERKGVVVRWRIGLEIVEGDILTLLGNVTVGQNDRITLPDGTQPPIMEVRGLRLVTGGVYYTQIVFGRPERGTVTQ